jgi:hypothetical protein
MEIMTSRVSSQYRMRACLERECGSNVQCSDDEVPRILLFLFDRIEMKVRLLCDMVQKKMECDPTHISEQKLQIKLIVESFR